MIKNLLYSLFIHFLLILVIYLNFNLRKPEENKTTEIAVSLVTLTGEEKSNIDQFPSAAKEESKKDEGAKKVEETKEAESTKITEKNKVKKSPKKLARAKVAKAVKKAVIEEKIKEFKPEEKEEIKQKDASKLQEDEVQNQNEDKEENDVPKKEEDSGAKKESTKESEEKKQENPKDSKLVDMANSLENLDLSGREKFNIQSQLKFCYRMAQSESKLESKTKVVAKVQISRDGKISVNFDDLINKLRYDDPDESDYRNTITNVKRALDLCSPLRNLPLDKYDIWKEVVLEFEE
jgi:hypothetical protein